MGNSDSKEEIIIKCTLEEMVKHFFKDYVVIWHDPNVDSPENKQHITQLKQFCEVLTFTEWEKALAAIQESKAACHVITSGTNGEVLVEEIYESSNVAKVYVFCINKEYHSTWAKKYQKVSCVETNIQTLINQLKQNLLEWYREISSIKVNLPAFAPIFNDTDKSQMNNLHRYLKLIPNFTNRLQAKTDFLNLSKLIYTDLHNKNLIADFEKSYNEYNKTQILKWYTKESFLYKVTNNCLRIATSDSIQYCRLLLKDIEQAIKDQYQAKSKSFTGLLYRGAYLSQEEWSSLKENQDKEVEMHGFLSVSKEKNVALNFMKIDPSKKVFITIVVPKGPNEEDQGFAEIEEFSLLPQEKEILFNVRSRFTVIETEEEYSPELPYRHLVLFYGAQGLRKFTAENCPFIRVPIPHTVKISCHCTQKTPENFLFKSLEKQIYYCKNCIDASKTEVLLCVPTKSTPTVREINVKGCLLTNNSNQFNIPFYGYKCSQCQAKKQKRYLICTDCSSETKPTWWCENCFTPTLNCIQTQHTILIETRPFSFWCQKMSENELSHFEFHNESASDYDPIFLQAEMYYQNHNYDKAIEYYTLYIQRNKTKIIDSNRGAAFKRLGYVYFEKGEYEKALAYHLKSVESHKFYFLGMDSVDLAEAYADVGRTYNCLKEYAKALEYHFKALDIHKSFRHQEDVATAYCNIGLVYRSQGEDHQALEYFYKALEIRKSLHGEDHASVATCYGYIGIMSEDQKEYSKALEYHLKCLNIEKSLYGENHLSIANSYNNLASVFSSQGEFNKALEYHLKCLNIEKSLYGENHPAVATSYFDMALIFSNQEEYDKALEYHLKSLNITKSILGENHPEVATSCFEIALIFFNQEEYDKALEYHLKSLEINKSLHGETHQSIATSYHGIAKVFSKQREYTKALEFHWKALEISKTVHGENSSQVASAYSKIATVFSQQGEYGQALEFRWKTLEISKTIHGENSLEVAIDYCSIGGTYLKQKEYTKGLECYLKFVEIEKSVNGDNHPDIIIFYKSIARKFYNQIEYGTALEFYWKALDISKTVYGENSSNVASLYLDIGDAELCQKEYTKSLEYSFKSLEIYKSLYGENHADVSNSYEVIGRIYLEQKEDPKALEYFEKSLEIRKSIFEENSKEIASCYYNIGRALNNQGEYKKAEELLLKAMTIQKIVLGENSIEISGSYYHLAGVYMNQKEHTKALEYCLKSLEIAKSVYGQDHPNTIKSQERVLEIQSLCL